MKVEKGAGGKKVRMEYENVFALGPLCGVNDPDTVIAASARCDELGVDTISTGGTIAWAMDDDPPAEHLDVVRWLLEAG